MSLSPTPPASTSKAAMPAWEILRKSVIFAPLSSEVLEAIWLRGKHVEYSGGEKLNLETPSVEFLNLILRGQMEVRRMTPERKASLRTVGSGFSYGSIDRVLGSGTFILAIAQGPCAVFTLHRNDLSSLLSQYQELTQRLSKVRMAIALRVAKEVEKRIETKAPVEKSRVAPRFPLYGRSLSAVLQDGTTLKIQDISDSGIFILGSVTESVGQTIHLTIVDKNEQFDPVGLHGDISRKTDQGFAIKVGELSPTILASWERLLTGVLTVEVEAIFKPELKRIGQGCVLRLSSGGVSFDAKVFSFGPEGAIVQLSSQVAKQVFEAELRLTQESGEVKALRLNAEVIERRGEQCLIRFLNLQANSDAVIQGFLVQDKNSSSQEKIEVSPKEKSEALRVFKRFIPNSVELCRLYFQELSDQMVILPGPLPKNVGDEVAIELELSYHALPVSRSQNMFLVKGKVIRLKGSDLVVELNAEAITVITKLKHLAAQVSQKRTEQTFVQAVRHEHDVKHRRYIQFFLILGLLVACAWWAKSTVIP